MPRPLPLLLLLLLLPSSSSISTNQEVLTLSNWITSNSIFLDWNPNSRSPCNWTSIACNPSGEVTEISIQSSPVPAPPAALCTALPSLSLLTISAANLTGPVPSSLSLCVSLTLLDLSSNSLSGTIPDTVSSLPYLQSLILNSNQLSGPIPAALSPSLRHLVLYDNRLSGPLPSLNLPLLETIRCGGNHDLSGPIPDTITNLTNLAVLGLAATKISGPLPSLIGRLSSLTTLSIYTTMLSGEIPDSIGNCSNLINIFLYENSLSGALPATLTRLQKLERILLWQNGLSGPLPAGISNLSSLISIDVSINAISGAIPSSIGSLPLLEELLLSDNNVSGSIPQSISNLTQLTQLQLDNNQMSGLIPGDLSSLTKLTILFAWENQLEGSIPASLAACSALQAVDLSHNHLTGTIPPAIFQIKNLTKLLLLSNDISGTIPAEIGSASSLIRLRLGSNRLSGAIPPQIGRLSSLSFLDLSGNRLSGAIPENISSCAQLQMLNISSNNLSGELPSSLSSIQSLQILDASLNRLTGEIPESFGRLTDINKLVLGSNLLSGTIPDSIGQCSSLELLDLSNNQLTGSIPDPLTTIEGLDILLNLSRNKLTGEIPSGIQLLNRLSMLDLSYNQLEGSLIPLANMENLVSLNLSNNNFTGYLPDTKLFRQLSQSNLAGNQGLCTEGGDICFISSDGETTMQDETRRLRKLRLAIALLVTLTVAALLGMIGVIRARRMGGGKCGREDSDSELGGEMAWPWQFTPFQKLSFSIEQVVGNLVDTNVIGKGCSGVVYRVDIDNGDAIAVKKLWPNNSAASKEDKVRDSFSAEVRTLGTIRHKNIVRFLGCCWNRSTRLLMYDYMANGSLGGLLHERNGFSLEWDLRYQIILGSAQGIAYLHHDCLPPIVHRDIKANNILIGLNFEPYIADFGLAKLVEDREFGRCSNTVAGSYGYIAPEYGYSMKITEKSDVYSYGVVMLEVLTGKQPIDPTIPDGVHLVDWVRRRKGSPEVLDLVLRGRPDTEVQEMLQAIGVALLCVSPTPEERPTMKDVAAMLKEIRLEREEYAKVDVLLKGTSPVPATMGLNATTSGANSVSGDKINSSSFSGSTTMYSTSKAKSPFGYNADYLS